MELLALYTGVASLSMVAGFFWTLGKGIHDSIWGKAK
jgi:hypothetical protein